MIISDPTEELVVNNHLSLVNRPTMTRCLLSVAVASSLLLVGCGDDSETTISYSTTSKPIATFTASDINQQVQAGAISGVPNAECGVTVEKVSYQTKGVADEVTNATAALMLPSGDNAECQGDRPVLLYAHGTTTEKAYDFSQVGNTQNPAAAEATLIAANFAAQGYIVVAPNYAGYDDSKLDYHPYLVAEQQSTDMIDALNSSRSIINKQKRANNASYINIKDSGKLFISGYSQGGHVAMATARRLEAQNKPITAIAPLSGPYALAAFGDFIFLGNVNIGATRFAPLLAIGLDKKYKNIYNNRTDIFTANYANTQLPNALSFGQLVAAGQLPDNALFQTKPTNNPVLDNLPASKLPFAAVGFDDSKYLINTEFRAAYITDAKLNPDGLVPTVTTGLPATKPQNNLRKALKANDLRGYLPKIPTLLCGGNLDPTVFYDLNTGSIAAILQQTSASNPAANLNVTVLDVDASNADERDQNTLTIIGQASMNKWDINDIVTGVQDGFANDRQQVISGAVQQGISPNAAVLASYHGGLVSNACTNATRQFFDQEFKPI